ncbi:hypothetical protein TARUN_3909 [Trichoderma arundinaceum]|uniref:Uncharacterized protein n=1 Tax=Trichoderma arundinaceum TaxID=490622 RepID=A0A395NQQ3_TRIAR|nr:hypothetical protein TARUN_3909 [Trichoderma arundinaceum]
MSRGDSIPRYTYTMDFNPMDEQSPLADFWQANDGLESEDAATIASLATQALQSKFNYEYGDDLEVNGQALVANYSESRSSPQSQYSAIIPAEPAESFRGLMEDHERGAQMSGEDAASEYELDGGARGHVSNDMAEIEESDVPSREHILPDPSMSVVAGVEVADQNSVSYEVEMSATITASHVVNEVLRRSSYAATPHEVGVNLHALQSQALQLTPPESESPISIDGPGGAEQEKEPTVNEQHSDRELETTIVEEPEPDTEVQQQLMAESNESSIRGDGKGSPPQRTPRARGRPRKSDMTAAPSEPAPQRTRNAKAAAREQANLEGDETLEPEAADTPEFSRTEEMLAARKRGRPRKSEIPEPKVGSAKRGPGRPPKLAAPEVALESTPTAGKRGRPRKSNTADATQAPTNKHQLPAAEAPATTPASSKRGRPRKSDVAGSTRAFAGEPKMPVDEVVTTTPARSKRGRPPKPIATTSTTTPGKRGRPPKGAVPTLQAETEVLSVEDKSSTVVSPVTKLTDQRDRSSQRADTLEAQAISPSMLPAKKRGRGRPPKNEALIATARSPDITAELESAVDAPESEQRNSTSKHTEDAAEELAANQAIRRDPTQEDIVATPARKRGRPKSIGAEKTPPVIDTTGVASVKKRGRPPKVAVTENSAKKRGRPSQSRVQETEEPVAKRRRMSDDTTMEYAPDIYDFPGETLAGRPPSVQGQKEPPAVTDTAHKQSTSTTASSRSSKPTEEITDPMSDNTQLPPLLARRARNSGEITGAKIPEESVEAKVAELRVAELPKSTVAIEPDEKRGVRKPAVVKTYGKRPRRSR